MLTRLPLTILLAVGATSLISGPAEPGKIDGRPYKLSLLTWKGHEIEKVLRIGLGYGLMAKSHAMQ